MIQHFGPMVNAHVISQDEPVIAWRSWRPNSSRRVSLGSPVSSVWWWLLGVGRPVLVSTFKDDVWPARSSMVATCHGGGGFGGNCNVTLGVDCHCGIWASKEFLGLVAHRAVGCWPRAVFGQVALWGTVLEYQHGFRATAARPIRVWLGNHDGASWGQRLARRYGIPVDSGVPVELARPLTADASALREPERSDAAS